MAEKSQSTNTANPKSNTEIAPATTPIDVDANIGIYVGWTLRSRSGNPPSSSALHTLFTTKGFAIDRIDMKPSSPLKSLKFRWLVLVVSHELIVFRA